MEMEEDLNRENGPEFQVKRSSKDGEDAVRSRDLINNQKLKKDFYSKLEEKKLMKMISREQMAKTIELLMKPELKEVRKIETNIDNIRKKFKVVIIAEVAYLFQNEHYSKRTMSLHEKYPGSGRFCPLEDIWYVLWEIHKDVGLTGRDAMLQKALQMYANITRPLIELFLPFSEIYKLKLTPRKNHHLVVKPFKAKTFDSRFVCTIILYMNVLC